MTSDQFKEQLQAVQQEVRSINDTCCWSKDEDPGKFIYRLATALDGTLKLVEHLYHSRKTPRTRDLLNVHYSKSDLLNALSCAKDASEGGSNDEEIEALKEALDIALDLLGLDHLTW